MWVVERQRVGGEVIYTGDGAGRRAVRGRHVGCVGRLQGDKSCRVFLFILTSRERGRPEGRQNRTGQGKARLREGGRQARQQANGLDAAATSLFPTPLIMAIVYAGTNTFIGHPHLCLRYASFSLFPDMGFFL